MAYYQSYNYTNVNQVLIDLAAFAADNGWTIDFNGVYNTSYRRLHIHKGQAHFDLYTAPGNVVSMFGCTGYDSGSTPNTQPGVNSATARNITYVVGRSYWFVSTIGALYLAVIQSNNYWYWGCLFIVSSKIGSWSDGFGLMAAASDLLFTLSCYSNPGYGMIYYNGSWSGDGAASRGLYGSVSSSDLPVYGPQQYNAGIIPFPVLLGVFSPTDTTKQIPMGFAPGLFRCNGGDVYDIGDEIIIGADTYLILPRYYSAIGLSSHGDFLFKLGA